MTDLTGRPDLWGSLIGHVDAIIRELQYTQTSRVNAASFVKKVHTLTDNYFYTIRSQLTSYEINVQKLDPLMQELLTFTHKRTSTTKYKYTLRNLRAEIITLKTTTIVSVGEKQERELTVGQTRIEILIIQTLEKIAPNSAKSYKQVLSDIADRNRISYKGTASEIREVLREILDILAPDKDVETRPGFKFEKDTRDPTKLLSTPTMKQKTNFILKSRGLSSGASKVPEDAVTIVEEKIASLTRSVYTRGSINTHTEAGISRSEINMLKMYVDTVLCELLALNP